MAKIGFNYLKQLFQTSTKTHGVSSIEVTIKSANLFSVGEDELFRQSYTIEELRKINNRTLILSSKPSALNNENSKVEVNELELQNETSVNHYTIEYDEDDIPDGLEEEIKEDHEETTKLLSPPPKNQGFFPMNILKMRSKYRPNVNPCQACFHGIHDSANCGHNRWWYQ